MCVGCWEEYGSPRIVNPAVLAAAKVIDAVYAFSCVGGNLHVVIDDWNLDLCNEADAYIATNIHEASAEQLAAERECLRLLLSLDEDERASALAIRDGYFDPVATS